MSFLLGMLLGAALVAIGGTVWVIWGIIRMFRN